MKLSKLLLVEDNQEAADLIIKIVEDAGHKVIHRTTGSEALALIQSEPFDGILLDYMLPDMDGLAFCRTLRETCTELPILLTSAYIGKISEQDMFDAGVTTFVPKPISQNIIQTIKKHITSQSMAVVEEKVPNNWLKKMLGGLYVEQG